MTVLVGVLLRARITRRPLSVGQAASLLKKLLTFIFPVRLSVLKPVRKIQTENRKLLVRKTVLLAGTCCPVRIRALQRNRRGAYPDPVDTTPHAPSLGTPLHHECRHQALCTASLDVAYEESGSPSGALKHLVRQIRHRT